MPTITLRPNSDNTIDSGYLTTGTLYYTEIDEAVASDSDKISIDLTIALGTQDALFGIESNSIPAGSTISSVKVYGRLGAASNDPNTDYNFHLLVNDNSTISASPDITIQYDTVSTVYGNESYDWTVRPSDSGSWTISDIDTLKIGVRAVYTGSVIGNTLIDTPTGKVKIKDIKKGDTVLSFELGKIVESKVKDTIEGVTDDNWIIINNRLVITPNHHIFTNKGLIIAGNAEVGDYLITKDKDVLIESIKEHKEVNKHYDITTEYGNYFANDFLIHNLPPPSPSFSTSQLYVEVTYTEGSSFIPRTVIME